MSLVLVSLVAAATQVAAEIELRPVPTAAVVAPLIVVMIFLMRSLSKQLKRIDFDETAETDEGRAARRERDDNKAKP